MDARLAVDDALPTGTCIVLVAPGGERSMLPDAGANSALAPADLPDSLLAPGGHLHLTGYSLVRPGPRPAALAAIARAAAAGMSVSVDPSSAALLGPEFLELAAGATLLLPNLAEARTLSGEGDAQAAARALASRFPEVVVKLGAEGALWTNGSDVELVPAAPAAALDTTGAGDAFAAGLLAARLRGAPPAEALAAGCALAAQAVVTPGARPPPPRPSAAATPRSIYAREGPLVHGGEGSVRRRIRSTSASFTSLLRRYGGFITVGSASLRSRGRSRRPTTSLMARRTLILAAIARCWLAPASRTPKRASS